MKTNALAQSRPMCRLPDFGRYRGLLQIIQFNWPWYVLAFAIFLSASAIVPQLRVNLIVKEVIAVGIACALFWTFASLLVSHWVYDLSTLKKWDWLGNFLPSHIKRAANIHCGFDETSGALHRVFSSATIFDWDIYRADLMTEGSIARARKLRPSASVTTLANFGRLPAAANALDTLFLIFAAHEIRERRAREKFFDELFRVLKPGGTLLLVEHLRDWKNFLAFGPGFLHFLPAQEWLRLSRRAGFLKVGQQRITPFVLILTLSKPKNL